MAKLKGKDDIAPYSRPSDERFKVRTRRYYISSLHANTLLIYSGYVMIFLVISLSGKGKLLRCLVSSRVRSRS